MSTRRIEIFCPKCKWRPTKKDRWSCRCGCFWNTFETNGTCPECGKWWEDTQCLACSKWSRHRAWYHEFVAKESEAARKKEATIAE